MVTQFRGELTPSLKVDPTGLSGGGDLLKPKRPDRDGLKRAPSCADYRLSMDFNSSGLIIRIESVSGRGFLLLLLPTNSRLTN